MIGEDEIKRRFTYHAPKEGQPEIYESLRQEGQMMARILDHYVPDSREKSLAFTKLEEVVFWANAAIAREGK